MEGRRTAADELPVSVHVRRHLRARTVRVGFDRARPEMVLRLQVLQDRRPTTSGAVLVEDVLVEDPGALAAAVLDSEAERHADQDRRSDIVITDDLLPGVGGDTMGIREVLGRGGFALVGVLGGLI